MTAVPIEPRARQRAPEPLHRRTYQRVRRNSRWAGREDWPYIDADVVAERMLALNLHRETLRQPGERTGRAPSGKPGDLGGISRGAADLFKLLCNIAIRGNGRLEPSAKYLAKALNTSMKMVHAWKAQLKRHGFLDWRRRYVERGLRGQRGPQVEQISNAYWTSAPKAALEAARALLKPKRLRAAAAVAPAAAEPTTSPRRAHQARLDAEAAASFARMKERLAELGTNVALDPSNWAPDEEDGT